MGHGRVLTSCLAYSLPLPVQRCAVIWKGTVPPTDLATNNQVTKAVRKALSGCYVIGGVLHGIVSVRCVGDIVFPRRDATRSIHRNPILPHAGLQSTC